MSSKELEKTAAEKPTNINKLAQHVCNIQITDEANEELLRRQKHSQAATSNNTVPRCPYCGSNNVNIITPHDKAVKYIALGAFSVGYVLKNFHCNSCGQNF